MIKNKSGCICRPDKAVSEFNQYLVTCLSKIEKEKIEVFAFVDLEKAFDRVPHKALEWALRQLKVDNWVALVILAMYNNAKKSGKCEWQLPFMRFLSVNSQFFIPSTLP